jgi:hypothetical protein
VDVGPSREYTPPRHPGRGVDLPKEVRVHCGIVIVKLPGVLRVPSPTRGQLGGPSRLQLRHQAPAQGISYPPRQLRP